MATLEQAWVETDYRPAAPNPHWLPSVDRPDLETPHPGYTHRSACPAMFLLPPHPPLPENTHGRCSPVDTPQSFHKPLVSFLPSLQWMTPHPLRSSNPPHLPPNTHPVNLPLHQEKTGSNWMWGTPSSSHHPNHPTPLSLPLLLRPPSTFPLCLQRKPKVPTWARQGHMIHPPRTDLCSAHLPLRRVQAVPLSSMFFPWSSHGWLTLHPDLSRHFLTERNPKGRFCGPSPLHHLTSF